MLNYQIGICAPNDFLPPRDAIATFTYFKTLEEGLDWADAVMALRVQKERHDGRDFDLQQYRKSYVLNSQKLLRFKADGWIMHPGPINYGVELEQDVLKDVRSLIMGQVENGVFMREALIRKLLKD